MRALDSYCFGSRKTSKSANASDVPATRASARRLCHSREVLPTQLGTVPGVCEPSLMTVFRSSTGREAMRSRSNSPEAIV